MTDEEFCNDSVKVKIKLSIAQRESRFTFVMEILFSSNKMTPDHRRFTPLKKITDSLISKGQFNLHTKDKNYPVPMTTAIGVHKTSLFSTIRNVFLLGQSPRCKIPS